VVSDFESSTVVQVGRLYHPSLISQAATNLSPTSASSLILMHAKGQREEREGYQSYK
jgi:hypothetical protein